MPKKTLEQLGGIHKITELGCSTIAHDDAEAERTSDRKMIKVKARGNESVEQMVKRFKKMCEKEGLNKDMKRNAYYEKPSERKRRRQRKSIKRVFLGG